jgi:hypothetical protein
VVFAGNVVMKVWTRLVIVAEAGHLQRCYRKRKNTRCGGPGS